MTGGAFEIGGVRAWISRSGYTGEDGFEISIPARDAEKVADLLVRAARGQADRPRRARFAAARGGAAALRPRSRHGDHAGRGGSRLRRRSSAAAPRAAFPAGTGILQRARGRPGPQARRPDHRGPAAGSRGRAGGRRRRQRGRQGHLGRLLAQPRAADRDGLCAARLRRARHQRCARAARQDLHRRSSRRCPSFPTATTAREPPNEPSITPRTMNGSASTATAPRSASPIIAQEPARRHRLRRGARGRPAGRPRAARRRSSNRSRPRRTSMRRSAAR